MCFTIVDAVKFTCTNGPQLNQPTQPPTGNGEQWNNNNPAYQGAGPESAFQNQPNAGNFNQYGAYQQPTGSQQHGNPYAAAATNAPAKKKRRWPWILLAILGFFLVAGALGGGGEEDTESASESSVNAAAPTQNTQTQQAAPTPSAPLPGIGAEARDGDFAFVVTQVEQGVTSVGTNPYLTKSPQGQFILVHVDVTNSSSSAQGYFSSNQKLTDQQGREFANDTEAEIYAMDDYVVGDINPGNTASVIIVFDVPLDAVPATVELHDSMFSSGVEVSLS